MSVRVTVRSADCVSVPEMETMVVRVVESDAVVEPDAVVESDAVVEPDAVVRAASTTITIHSGSIKATKARTV